MNNANQNMPAPKPRWDGGRILFQIKVSNIHVPCAISRGALTELAGRNASTPADVLKLFLTFRDRVEGIAADIFSIRPENITGIISVWASDIDDPPSAPAVAQLMPRRTQAQVQ